MATETKNGVILLIGGCGYVGVNLSKKFVTCGYDVVVVDISHCPTDIANIVTYHQCGATNSEALGAVIASSKPIAVIHLASTGMSGSPMLNPACRTINVGATEVAIECCVKGNVPVFIYTSTYNVVYGGKEIINGDEDTPYFPIEGHNDHYAPSKTIAEKLALAANGRTLANGHKLKTCAIRPAAIYGEGEQRHFPRLLKHFDSGIFLFRIGTAIVDWVHVENLSEAFLCAFKTLSSLEDSDVNNAPAGHPYFISDGSPIDNFEFFRPLCGARYCSFPTITIPTTFMLGLGWLLEYIHYGAKSFGIHFEPFLTRAEVLKVGFSHYFKIDRAKKDLGYQPKFGSKVGGERIANYYKIKSLDDNVYFFRMSSWYWWPLCLLGMGLTGFLAYQNMDFEQNLLALGLARQQQSHILWIAMQELLFIILKYANMLALLLFRSQFGVQLLFWLACSVHVGESCLAYRAAKSLGCMDTLCWLWAFQTLLLGFPSLSLLQERQEIMKKLEQQAIMKKLGKKFK